MQQDELLPDGAVRLWVQPLPGMCDSNDAGPNAARLVYHLDGGLKVTPRTRILRKDSNLKTKEATIWLIFSCQATSSGKEKCVNDDEIVIWTIFHF